MYINQQHLTPKSQKQHWISDFLKNHSKHIYVQLLLDDIWQTDRQIDVNIQECLTLMFQQNHQCMYNIINNDNYVGQGLVLDWLDL